MFATKVFMARVITGKTQTTILVIENSDQIIFILQIPKLAPVKQLLK